ncbi:YgfZ/GcvT domain-containing protein [Octadecabacter sp. R77987]|uniref:CAF17-like 4Fe-4S cluster assembly/insertion protein YgfZ n=1 Tax=Octadecabacter sp. R77987 TaxID=3093874 RepID=UPI00366D5D3F
MTDRTVLALTGADRTDFLQGLVTNDITRDGLVYCALLTPQGKYIADFFTWAEDDRILIDVASSHAPTLAQRLNMYRLRADVQIAESGLIASRGTAEPPKGVLEDPRHPALGWRSYGDTSVGDDTDWDALRVAHCVPETGVELTPDTYILEAGFERLHGIDFRKGCYVGQEIAARMKHKTQLRKGLRTVAINGAAPVGTDIMAGEKPAGTLFTQSGGQAIAYLRFDRAVGDMTAGTATITLP